MSLRVSSGAGRFARTALPLAPLAIASIPAAKATLIYTEAPDTTVTTASTPIYVDFGTGGSTGAIGLSNFAGVDFNIQDRYTTDIPKVFLYGTTKVATSSGSVVNFAAGSVIDVSTYFTSSNSPLNNNGNNNAHWAAGTEGYIGFSFNGGSGTVYGWAHVSYNSDKSITVYDFAYEDSGGAITVPGSPIPEPSTTVTLAGLVAGAAAVYTKRRRPVRGATAAA